MLRDVEGETAKEWARHTFEFELCEECHGDAKDHDIVLVLGHWFARCKVPETKVLFRYWRDTVIAIFPEDLGTYDEGTCSSYMHVGQHSACTPDGIVRESRPATEAEYAALRRELEGEPYCYRLKVIQRLHPAYTRTRRAELRKARA